MTNGSYLAVLILLIISCLASTITALGEDTQSKDAKCLATTLMSEASIGTNKERIAVAWTIFNRVNSPNFPNTICEVTNQSNQYATNQAPTQEVLDLATSLIANRGTDPTGGAIYFFSPRSMPKEGESTRNYDVGGGLHEVDGIDKKVYFPSFTLTTEYTGNIPGVRPAYYMFFREPTNAAVVSAAIADAFYYPIGTPRSEGGTGYVTHANDGDGWYNAQDWQVYNSDYSGYHPGEDWNDERGGSSDVGAPIYAIAKGVVTAVTSNVAGRGIAVKHTLPTGESIYSVYIHIAIKSGLSVGSGVGQGEQIGTIADTTSTHLHFEIRTKPVNPKDWYPNDRGNGYYASKEALYADGFTVNPSDFIDSHRSVGDSLDEETQKPGPFTLTATTACIEDKPQVRLSWTASNGAQYYNAMRGQQGVSGLHHFGSVTETQFIDSEVTAGDTYEYYIAASNKVDMTNSNSILIKIPSVCETGSQSPILIFTGTEPYLGSQGNRYVRYKLSVTNWDIYPQELFKPAPDLESCGLNKNASRTWISIYDQDDSYLYGFCAFSSPEDLKELWFGVKWQEVPPQSVYIKMIDRRSGITYTSNKVRLPNNAVTEQQNQPPNVPNTLSQFKVDGSSISVGAQIAERSVAFKAKVSNTNGGKLKLQVELRRLDEYGGQYDETKGGLKESDKVDSNKEATAYAHGLINGYYHWRARVIDESGKASNWVDFGNNNQRADLIVFSNTEEQEQKTEQNTGTVFNKGDRVRTTSDNKLNVRRDPGTSSPSIGTMVKGSMGTIVNGPVFADNLNWWKLEYDSGITGWSSGKWLELVYETQPPTADSLDEGNNLESKGKIFSLSTHYKSDELYMTLNSIKVMEGYAPDYRTGGDWYFQLFDRKQRVLEEKHFSFSNIRCSDIIDENGQWSGGCQAEEETDLDLMIPWHPDAWMITIYDGQGFVRFGPYDVSGLR